MSERWVNVHAAIKELVALYYRACPELVPFSGGIDRAESFGEESAAVCAARKLRAEKRDFILSRRHPTGNKLLRQARRLPPVDRSPGD